MQTQVLTINTNQINTTDGASFQITTFEQNTSAMCDCCGASASGKKNELERRGWYMGSREQFCPNCNY